MIQFNLDGGRGSQKLMAHYVFDDDPVLSDDSTEEDRKAYAAKYGGYKDTGIAHTLILGWIKGGKEDYDVRNSYSTTSWMLRLSKPPVQIQKSSSPTISSNQISRVVLEHTARETCSIPIFGQNGVSTPTRQHCVQADRYLQIYSAEKLKQGKEKMNRRSSFTALKESQ